MVQLMNSAMMVHLEYVVTLTLAAVAFALVEIQVEGQHGWAAHLPTWRIENRWTRLFCGRRPLTGYHLYAQFFVLVLVHLPFGLGLAPLTLGHEARVLSFLTFFWVLEDFLWFVLNPAFGLKRFRPQHIWWHAPTWWGLMPRDYWLFLPVGFLLYWASY